MIGSWIGIFVVSLVAEIVTTCYYRALAAEGPGRRGRAMLWSGACRIIGLLLLKHVVSEHGAAGLVAASGFVAGDVAGTWLALWNEDRRAAPVVPAAPTLSAAEVSALIDARLQTQVETRVAAVVAALRGEDERSAAVAHWRAPAYGARRPAASRALHLAE